MFFWFFLQKRILFGSLYQFIQPISIVRSRPQQGFVCRVQRVVDRYAVGTKFFIGGFPRSVDGRRFLLREWIGADPSGLYLVVVVSSFRSASCIRRFSISSKSTSAAARYSTRYSTYHHRNHLKKKLSTSIRFRHLLPSTSSHYIFSFSFHTYMIAIQILYIFHNLDLYIPHHT